MDDPAVLERMGAAGRTMAAAHRGATARQLRCFDAVLAGASGAKR